MNSEANNLDIGYRLNSVSKTLDQDRMDRFEKVGRILITEGEETDEPTNIHTDPEKAKAMGLERPIACGQMSYSYIHEMLCREF